MAKRRPAASPLEKKPSRRPVPPTLRLTVQYACNNDALPSRQRVRRWVLAALERDAEITVRFVETGEGRHLNKEFRGRDRATNVLSFPYEHAPKVSGDLVVCAPVVLREASAQNKTPDATSPT